MQVNLSTIIGQWRPIAARLTEWNRAVPTFKHLHTLHGKDGGDDDGLQHGHVVWGTLTGPLPMAICWEWAELRAGVVAIFNPMNVLSNVRLVSEQGHPFTFGQSVLAFNSVVHEADWQSKVCAELRFHRVGGKSVITMTPRSRGAGDSVRQRTSARSAPSLQAMAA